MIITFANNNIDAIEILKVPKKVSYKSIVKNIKDKINKVCGMLRVWDMESYKAKQISKGFMDSFWGKYTAPTQLRDSTT